MEALHYFFIAGVVAATAVSLAQRKNRSVTGWFIGCFIAPILILPLLALPPLPGDNEKRPPSDETGPKHDRADR